MDTFLKVAGNPQLFYFYIKKYTTLIPKKAKSVLHIFIHTLTYTLLTNNFLTIFTYLLIKKYFHCLFFSKIPVLLRFKPEKNVAVWWIKTIIAHFFLASDATSNLIEINYIKI